LSEAARTELVHARANKRESDPAIRYAEVQDFAAATPTLEDVYAWLRDAAARHGVGPILRVGLTAEELPLQVVKVIVPRMEFYTGDSGPRMGPRLRKILDGRTPRSVF